MKFNFSRYNLFGFLGGLVLLILPIFFDKNFNGGWFSVLFYMLLILIGVSISICFLAKMCSINPIYLFLLAGLCEIGIFLSIQAIKNDQITSPSLIKKCRSFYTSYLRSIPAYQSGLGKYDTDLFYTLKPNISDNNLDYVINANIEFSNTYKINSLGVRDDEFSLNFPEIIVLGDSHLMGWGVDQNRTFSSLLEQQIKKKVLNTGIASYGSAREYLMFSKVKNDSCKTVIWQYCANDMLENQSFLENGNQLKVSSEEGYEFVCKRNFIQASYYPFKFSFEIFAHQFRRIKGRNKFKNQPKFEISEQVNNFFSIVKLLQEDFAGEIIIFNLESNKTTDKYFLAFKNYLKNNHLEKIKLINFSKILNEDDYFIIDDHINVSGHQKVSDAILKIIQSELDTISEE